MELNLWFSFLLLHVIHVQSLRQWLVNVPRKIPAVEGSCVVIPCSYSFPWRPGMPNEKRRTGFWKIGNKVIATTRPNWKLLKEYKRRTDFLGDLQALNCTVLLEGVRSTDVGPFHFRIEMDRYKSYSYIKNPVYIDVISDPAPPSMSVQGTGQVTASCSVTHSCPTSPPTFAWSRPENAIRRLKKLNTWQWKTVSTLTFSPGSDAFNQTLNCTVRYSGGKQATSSTVLPM